MPLTAGTTLGPYTVTAKIGEGGTDTRSYPRSTIQMRPRRKDEQ